MANNALVETEVVLGTVAAGIIDHTMSHDRAITHLESLLLFLEERNEDFTPTCTLIREAVEALGTPVTSGRGRPAFIVDMSTVENLLAMNFRLRYVAKLLGVSERTLHRRLKAAGISVRSSYSNISEEQLEQEIASTLLDFPNTGYKRMIGFLLSKQIKVTQYQVRDAMRRVDPEGVYLRTSQNRAIVRRQYFVPYSNSLWHIDTNLKLSRWKYVIRGGLDGKSRTCLFLEAGNNNRAESKFNSFLKGVERYGIPYRCRSDKGGENRLVAQYMLEMRGLGRGSHICGKSVHNQRIERFWKDLGYGFISFYKQVFYWMENSRILDIENPEHIYALHFTFLPRINNHLQQFMDSWNHHPLSTEQNKTPQQLMLIHLPPPEHDLLLPQELEDTSDSRINEFSDLSLLEEDTIHTFSTYYPTISDAVLQNLSFIDPLRESSRYGEDVYLDVLRILNNPE